MQENDGTNELWGLVLAFEEKKLNSELVVEWFDSLIKTGYIWKLPTSYLDNATTLIVSGYIGDKTRELDS